MKNLGKILGIIIINFALLWLIPTNAAAFIVISYDNPYLGRPVAYFPKYYYRNYTTVPAGWWYNRNTRYHLPLRRCYWRFGWDSRCDEHIAYRVCGRTYR
jgi:hypothetical protein